MLYDKGLFDDFLNAELVSKAFCLLQDVTDLKKVTDDVIH